MPYTNSMATPRADVAALVMQANADFNKLFIAEDVFPVKGEDMKRGIYMKATLANALLVESDSVRHGSGDSYNRINRKYDTDTFDAQEWGLEATIPDDYAEEVDRFMNLEKTEAMLLERALRIAYEQRVAALLFNSAYFNTTATSAAYTTANIATMDPVSDVDYAKQRLMAKGITPNAVVMSLPVFNRIRRATLMQNQVFGVVPRTANQRMLPSEQDIAEAFGVETLYVAKAPVNANAEGNNVYSGSFIWSTAYVAVCQIGSGEYEAGGVGRTIQWTKDTTGLFTPETYRDDTRRSNVIRVRQHTAEKIIDETSCELLSTSYS